MKKILHKVVLSVFLMGVLFVGFLYINNDIGKTKNSLKEDIRLSQKIFDDWNIEGSTSDTMAAFISMNTQNVVRIEIDDGNSIQVIDIDGSKPFAIVLPLNVGNVSFYDLNGNVVEYLCRSL